MCLVPQTSRASADRRQQPEIPSYKLHCCVSIVRVDQARCLSLTKSATGPDATVGSLGHVRTDLREVWSTRCQPQLRRPEQRMMLLTHGLVDLLNAHSAPTPCPLCSYTQLTAQLCALLLVVIVVTSCLTCILHPCRQCSATYGWVDSTRSKPNSDVGARRTFGAGAGVSTG